MVNLQEATIKQYKELFPKETLKEISVKTKIQITRLFRLFNGSEMKISEYEVFQNLMDEKVNNNDFYKLAKKCTQTLSYNRMNYIYAQMSQAIKVVGMQTPTFNTEASGFGMA